ncbi:MAG: FtsW/RodA/SpoVE family cell cycle protein [Vicinamibacterales bacterium]
MRIVSTASAGGAPARVRLIGANVELAGLVAASVVTLASTVLAFNGHRATTDLSSTPRRTAVLNVNDARSLDELASHLDVFESAADRQLAARHLHQFVQSERERAGPLENVGALARARIPVAAIEQARDAVAFRGRLADERAAAEGTLHDAPVLVFTAAQLSDVKPRLIVRGFEQYRRRLLFTLALMLAGFYGAHLWRRFARTTRDPVLLPIVHLLCGIGFVSMIALRDPLRDTTPFLPFAQGVAGGCVVLVVIGAVDLERWLLKKQPLILLLVTVTLSTLLLVFGTGPGMSDAKVNLWGVQPAEPIRLLVVLLLAAYFAARWEFLRELREDPRELPRWLQRLRLPKQAYVRPVVASMAVVLLFFFLQKDLGPALVVACLFLALYGVARRRVLLVATGFAILAAGFGAGYLLQVPRTVWQRVELWRAPWTSGLSGGEQLAHAAWAFATGGVWGQGLGLGDPQSIPVGHTDLVLAALGEELGFMGVSAVMGLFAVLVWRGFRIASRAPSDYFFFLALGMTLSVVFQALLIAAGQLALVPLSGVVTPFLSFGRSSMLTNFAAVGIILAVAERAQPARRAALADPARWIAGLLAAVSLIVLGRLAWVQIVAADSVMIRPTLVRQADGTLRYVYNPRLAAAALQIPRGTILDRNGVPLATNASSGQPIDAALHDELRLPAVECGDEIPRCYPFGGLTYHVLGDANTQRNWSARNTAFIERDFDARLRGYDDRAERVAVTDGRHGSTVQVTRRDYRALVPLVRHRHRPGHPAVQALLNRPRDVRLSLDIRLQARVGAALRRRIQQANLASGAAVVFDPETGDTLAAVSYPWPERTRASARAEPGHSGDAFLDRVRFGLYPPGSTFKLVVAAAALRTDPELARQTFQCRRLPDGRVGNDVAGVTRPVRDDVLDKAPHGRLALEEGIVVSCNAYFAQLGLRTGAASIAEVASLLQIPVARPNTADRLRLLLPHASYGQGEVLASPFRMGRVGAAIASNGTLVPAKMLMDPPEPPGAAVEVLSPGSARLIARAMRDAVRRGTGRVLAANATPIAGKTGTAELDDTPSHSWFVGFAPYGAAGTPQVAFAVVVERAGYGARTAAPIAGDIVDAARELGLLAGRPAGATTTGSP